MELNSKVLAPFGCREFVQLVNSVPRLLCSKGEWWAGIDGLLNQDAAVQESAGAIYDRSKEHLVSGDTAVVKVRQIMLGAARAVQAGKTPPGLDPSIRFDRIRSEKILVPAGTPWKELGVLEGVEGN